MTPQEREIIIETWGSLPHFTPAGTNEYHSTCPRCGDSGHIRGTGKPDRFHMHGAEGKSGIRGACRKCGYLEWAENKIQHNPPAVQVAGGTDAQNKKRQSKLNWLATKKPYLKYHKGMKSEHIKMWLGQGVSEQSQEKYKLGFVRDRKYSFSGNLYTSAALTIPMWGYKLKVDNIQFRLMTPQDGAGKYRALSDLTLPLFNTEPEIEIGGEILVVEGSKKAIVVKQELLKAGISLSVIAIPSKAPALALIRELGQSASMVYIALDPDAYMATRDKMGRRIAPSVSKILQHLVGLPAKIRLVTLPVKPDDLFVEYKQTAEVFMRFITGATVIK